jgi:hypothetical protein
MWGLWALQNALYGKYIEHASVSTSQSWRHKWVLDLNLRRVKRSEVRGILWPICTPNCQQVFINLDHLVYLNTEACEFERCKPSWTPPSWSVWRSRRTHSYISRKRNRSAEIYRYPDWNSSTSPRTQIIAYEFFLLARRLPPCSKRPQSTGSCLLWPGGDYIIYWEWGGVNVPTNSVAVSPNMSGCFVAWEWLPGARTTSIQRIYEIICRR